MQSFGDHYLYDGLGTVIALGPQPHPLVSCDSSDGALAYAEENERDHAALVAVKKGRVQAVVDEPQQAVTHLDEAIDPVESVLVEIKH